MKKCMHSNEYKQALCWSSGSKYFKIYLKQNKTKQNTMIQYSACRALFHHRQYLQLNYKQSLGYI